MSTVQRLRGRTCNVASGFTACRNDVCTGLPADTGNCMALLPETAGSMQQQHVDKDSICRTACWQGQLSWRWGRKAKTSSSFNTILLSIKTRSSGLKWDDTTGLTTQAFQEVHSCCMPCPCSSMGGCDSTVHITSSMCLFMPVNWCICA